MTDEEVVAVADVTVVSLGIAVLAVWNDLPRAAQDRLMVALGDPQDLRDAMDAQAGGEWLSPRRRREKEIAEARSLVAAADRRAAVLGR